MSLDHVNGHSSADLGLGRGMARVLASLGVVGFLCLLVAAVLLRYADFVEGESAARRDELRLLIAEWRMQREADQADRKQTAALVVKVMSRIDAGQVQIDEAIQVLQTLAKELRAIKAKGG